MEYIFQCNHYHKQKGTKHGERLHFFKRIKRGAKMQIPDRHWDMVSNLYSLYENLKEKYFKLFIYKYFPPSSEPQEPLIQSIYESRFKQVYYNTKNL